MYRKRTILLASLAAIVAVVIALPAAAGTDVKTLTNGVGCDAADGAYGDAFAWYDYDDGVVTVGNTNSGCQMRIVDSASFYYSGSWHTVGGTGYLTYNVYIYSGGAASESKGTHRICGVGPVCGSSQLTHAFIS
ncbi:MAG: hypothetical protein C0506_16055 [Anaerolinea sp.]|nr:hypothetical protein [Anaerolinea sp.]